jgi:O-antigen ligase
MTMVVNVKLRGFSFSLSTWHTNSYSAVSAMLFCYCLGEFKMSSGTRRRLLLRYGTFGLATLVLGTSTASYAAAAWGALLILLLRRNVLLGLVGGWVLAIVLVMGLDLSGFGEALMFGKSEQDYATLSGRTLIWDELFRFVKQSPLIGHGFAVLSTGRGQVFSSQPHNSVFSILLGTGFIGLSIVIAFLVKLIADSLRCLKFLRPGAIGCICAINAALVNSLAMPLIFDEWEESSLALTAFLAFFASKVVIPVRKEWAASAAMVNQPFQRPLTRVPPQSSNPKAYLRHHPL